MDYEIRFVYGHVEVYDQAGRFGSPPTPSGRRWRNWKTTRRSSLWRRAATRKNGRPVAAVF